MARDDAYGSMGSVPNVENQGVSNAGISVRATPDSFGGQIGQAITGAGKEAEQIGNHFAQIVTEAKVNDDYANKYVPAAAQLKQNYDTLNAQDKVAGYEDYIKGLHGLNEQFTTMQPGIIGQKSMSGLINRHIAGEVMSAKSELVTSQKQFAQQAQYDLINSNIQLAAQNYKNPEIIQSVEQQNDNHILINHIDNGHDPNNVASKSIIEDAQTNMKGQMAASMIRSAFNTGDATSANEFRSQYASVIPGYQKLAIDNTLHTQNMQQNGIAAVSAIKVGQPLPEVIGAPPSGVRALVANTAKDNEIDPNHALTVLRIESADGKNLGERGTLGQDKESAGKSLDEQAKALCDNLKMANAQASTALGRNAEPWEAYAVYQQGSGGGAALLKADPNAKAIDILTPYYDNPRTALQALSGNGGNVTMTAGDFTDHIKQVWDDNYKRSACDFSNIDNPGEAILKPHQALGQAVQPSASPIQAQLNFEKKVPAIMEQINNIPSYDDRAGVMRAFNQDRQRYNDAANSYKNVLINQAGQLAADPKFVSMDMIPPEMHAALATDHPQTLDYMERHAQTNLDKQSGNITKDMKEYGNGFYDLFNKVHSLGDDKINSVAELQKHVGKDGDLTIAGYDRLSKEIAGKNTPEGDAEGIMKKNFITMAKQEISGKDDMLGIKDPQGEENYQRFLTQVLPVYEQGRAEGKSAAELLNPDSKDYIGKSIQTFKRPLSEQMADMERATQGLDGNKPEQNKSGFLKRLFTSEPDISTPEGLRRAVISGKMTRATAEAEALKRGYIKTKPIEAKPTVPLAQ